MGYHWIPWGAPEADSTGFLRSPTLVPPPRHLCLRLIQFTPPNASSRLRHNVMSRTLPSQDRPSSSSSSSPEQETTSKLDLHQLPDDRPVFACHKCSEVIVGSPSPMVYVDTRLKSRVGTAGRTGLQGVQWPVRTSLVYLPFRYLNPPTGIDVTRCSV